MFLGDLCIDVKARYFYRYHCNHFFHQSFSEKILNISNNQN